MIQNKADPGPPSTSASSPLGAIKHLPVVNWRVRVWSGCIGFWIKTKNWKNHHDCIKLLAAVAEITFNCELMKGAGNHLYQSEPVGRRGVGFVQLAFPTSLCQLDFFSTLADRK